jgi:predicted nucleic acid-binding protein
MTPVLLDSSVLIAWLDKRDHSHRLCSAVRPTLRPPLMTCEAVITESCYLLQKVPGAAEAILANIAKGTFQIPFQVSECASDVQQILRKYRDTPADFADACLIHMADQLDTGDILTLDSDFKHYRWRRNRRFRMLIPLD